MTGSAVVRTVNPATDQIIAEYAAFTADDLDSALSRAETAAALWRQLPVKERTTMLSAAAHLLRSRRDGYARLITTEMGKPISEATAEVDKCAWNCEYVAQRAEQFLADEPASTTAKGSWVAYEPLGVVLAIMPWNFPFWQVLRFAPAALVAGNATVLKHSPNVTGCALALEQLFRDAGLPTDVFTTAVVAEAGIPDTISRIVADPRIDAITLTGSDRAGMSVGVAAGKALKKTVLELGGSDPLVVLDDADLVAAVAGATQSRFGNAGQSCIAAKRFIVGETVADEFVGLLEQRVAGLPVGNPLDPATRIGPMARPNLVEAIDRQVQQSVADGAALVMGGRRMERAGCFYAPTILDRVRPDMAVFTEETFGPVAAVIRARDDDHAVDLANDTVYGLGAAVWGSADRALAVGRRIRSGALFINSVVASDPRLPFGGIRRSGHGRELAAVGVREFTNVRTIWVGDPALVKTSATVLTE